MTHPTDKGMEDALARADVQEARRRLASREPSWRVAIEAAETLLDTRFLVEGVLDGMPAPATSSELRRQWTACSDLALRTVLDFNVDALRRVARLSQDLEQTGPEASRAPEPLIVRAWLKLLEGDCEDAAKVAEDAIALAHREGSPMPLLDGTVVSALAHLARGDFEAATSSARRASRMARTEGILQREYLANLALARVRRYAGRVHLASRIVLALARVVPTPWCNWIALEFFLCGGGQPPTAEPSALTQRLAGASRRMGQVSWAGDMEAIAKSLPTLFESEVRSFVACTDSRNTSPVPARTTRWIEGKEGPAPPGLGGFLAAPSGGDLVEPCGVYVLVEPGRPARRFLAVSVDQMADGSVVLPAPELKKRRTFELLCILALSGGHLAETDLFRRLYGFEYASEKHGGMLRTLIYRARQAVEGHGTIERADGAMALQMKRAVCIPDPRCVPTLEDTILRALAQSTSKLDATAIATTVGVPLRTVRRALSPLIEDGSCVVEKVGRTAHFSVEDTTFYEPSFTRLGQARRSVET